MALYIFSPIADHGVGLLRLSVDQGRAEQNTEQKMITKLLPAFEQLVFTHRGFSSSMSFASAISDACTRPKKGLVNNMSPANGWGPILTSRAGPTARGTRLFSIQLSVSRLVPVLVYLQYLSTFWMSTPESG
jgi:hypothetical protein